MNTVIELNKIRFRPTTEGDLDFVIRLEQDEYNSQFIRHWPRKRQIETINDNNCAHFVIETINDNKRVGFVILIGVQTRIAVYIFSELQSMTKAKAMAAKQ